MQINYNREPQFGHFATHELFPFIKQFPIEYIRGQANFQIAYRFCCHQENPGKLIILVNGRASSILKMTEAIYDFYNQGYDVLAFDHRGQGYSQRFQPDQQKGHIDQFRNYFEDIDELLQSIYRQRNYQKQSVIAHSFGALIMTGYLANYPHDIGKIIFTAPFYGLPKSAPSYTEVAVNFMMLLSQGNRYLFGKGPYKPTNLKDNELSSCQSRLRWTNIINRHYPKLALGGATFRWLHQCLNQHKLIDKYLKKITQPMLVICGEKDTMIPND